MKEFTFGIITYNHESLIIECLESIKYLIRKYGKDERVSIVLSDDCSRDNTVEIAEKWLVENKDLFNITIVLQADSNQGIVKNMMKLYGEIKTIRFKTISGDDLFNDCNIFEMDLRENTIIISPVFTLDGNSIKFNEMHMFRYFSAILHEKNLLTYYRKEIPYYFPVSSVGLAFSGDLINEKLFSELQPYKWIDDLVVFNYLIHQDTVRVIIDYHNYILYRDNVGVSRNKKHEKRGFLSEDNDLIRDNIFKKNRLFDKRSINPIRYYLWLKRQCSRVYIFIIRNDLKKKYRDLKSQKENVEEYYRDIHLNSQAWLATH